MMHILSDREQAALDFIAAYYARHGYAPTVRETGQAVGMASSSASRALLRRLEAKGHLRRAEGISRGLVVMSPASTEDALTDAVAAERRRCYEIAFNTPATSKEAIRVKASIADAIACGDEQDGAA